MSDEKKADEVQKQDEFDVTEPVQAPEKKKRGRPRKAKVETVVIPVVEPKRGRPVKVQVRAVSQSTILKTFADINFIQLALGRVQKNGVVKIPDSVGKAMQNAFLATRSMIKFPTR